MVVSLRPATIAFSLLGTLFALLVATPTFAQSAPSGDFRIESISMCKQIEQGKPVDVAESFQVSDKKAYCHLLVYNQTGEKQTITFRWVHDGKEHFRFENTIGRSKAWNTNAVVKLRKGSWKVEILHNGEVIAEKPFEVTD